MTCQFSRNEDKCFREIMTNKTLCWQHNCEINERKAAGIIVVRYFGEEMRVLALVKRNNYDIPKGEIEFEETDLAAALRETDEEANITELDFKWGYHKILSSRVTIFVATTTQEGNIKVNPNTLEYEHEGLKWVTWDELFEKVYRFLIPGVEWAKNMIEQTSTDF